MSISAFKQEVLEEQSSKAWAFALTSKNHSVERGCGPLWKRLILLIALLKYTDEEVKSSTLDTDKLCYPVSAAQMSIIYLLAFFCFT